MATTPTYKCTKITLAPNAGDPANPIKFTANFVNPTINPPVPGVINGVTTRAIAENSGNLQAAIDLALAPLGNGPVMNWTL